MALLTPRPRAKACIQCRQQKVLCDRLETNPRPCTRCLQRGLHCIYQPDFVREKRRRSTSTTRSLDQVSHTASLTPCQPSTSPSSLEGHTESQSAPSPGEGQWPLRQSSSFSKQPEVEHHASNFEPYQGPSARIDDIFLTSNEVNSYLEYFFNRMHCHFPFFGKIYCARETLSISPLLFWALIAVSSGFQNRALYSRLQPCVRRLLAGTIVSYLATEETCQALCLMSLWPFEAVQPNDDPHFMYAGMATHIAMQIGLHRPEFINEFKNIDELPRPQSNERSHWMTWCACLFVEHQLAHKTGVSCGPRDYWLLQKSLNGLITVGEQQLPPLIRHHLLLVELRDRFLASIAWDGASKSGLCEPVERLSLLALFCTELDQFESRQGQLDILSLVILHGAHVTIAGLCLAVDLINLEHQASERTLLLRRGITSASATLNLIAPLAWETLPVHIHRAVLHSGVFAARLLAFESHKYMVFPQPASIAEATVPNELYEAAASDSILHTQGRELVKIVDRAVDLLRSVSFGRDFPTRGKMVLEALKVGTDQPANQREDPANNLGVKFAARMGASLYWDAVEHKKERHDWAQNAKDILREMQEHLDSNSVV